MVVRTNISAVNSGRVLTNNTLSHDKSMEKLSSGKRINRSADDAAGLVVSKLMDSQVRGLKQAGRNMQDSLSLVQTAEGFMSEVQDNLIRLKELAVQSANGTYRDEQRELLQVEVDQIFDEIDRIAAQASFNEMKLLASPTIEDPNGKIVDGAGKYIYADEAALTELGVIPVSVRTPSVLVDEQAEVKQEKSFTLKTHVGSNKDEGVALHLFAVNSKILFGNPLAGSDRGLDLRSATKANQSMNQIDKAIEAISAQRANIGAFQNRLESSFRTNAITVENTMAASSRIKDLDMAVGVTDNIKNNILSQVSLAMLSQANLRKQSVLQLLN